MNIQQLVDTRGSLNQLQFTSLVDMLIYKQRKKSKQAIREVLKNNFYTIFDENPFSKKFELHNEFVEFKGNDAELKAIRIFILAIY